MKLSFCSHGCSMCWKGNWIGMKFTENVFCITFFSLFCLVVSIYYVPKLLLSHVHNCTQMSTKILSCSDISSTMARLSTTVDEVSVYPIPAFLYLVKNLLQVGFDIALLIQCTPIQWLLIILNCLLKHICICSITSLRMQMLLDIRYSRI